MATMTQAEKILNYCEKNGSITIREAFTVLGINSPSKRISELRKSGLFDITKERVITEDSHYDRYYIKSISA